jgi:hypothetical protein
MKNIILASLGLFLGVSCTDSSSKITAKKGEIKSSIAATDETESELKASLAEIEKEEQARLALLSSTYTTMSFDKMTQNFGKIKEDSENKASFVVTNSGKNPLIIEKVDVSCGCTTAQKPEKPILPGKSDRIEVIFHPKIGQLNEQKKTVTVVANTEPKITVLNIEAYVEAKGK